MRIAATVRYRSVHSRIARSPPATQMTGNVATWGTRGMAVAPHSLAAESAVAVLREGGHAVEAIVAAAASIAVVYPRMNSIGATHSD